MSNPLLVLVTGANQGLGYYATQILAKTGKYHVILGSRDLEKGKSAVKSLLEDSDISPSAIEPIQIDITSDESIKRAAADVLAKYGKLDILINNAGIAHHNASKKPRKQNWTHSTMSTSKGCSS